MRSILSTKKRSALRAQHFAIKIGFHEKNLNNLTEKQGTLYVSLTRSKELSLMFLNHEVSMPRGITVLNEINMFFFVTLL